MPEQGLRGTLWVQQSSLSSLQMFCKYDWQPCHRRLLWEFDATVNLAKAAAYHQIITTQMYNLPFLFVNHHQTNSPNLPTYHWSFQNNQHCLLIPAMAFYGDTFTSNGFLYGYLYVQKPFKLLSQGSLHGRVSPKSFAHSHPLFG